MVLQQIYEVFAGEFSAVPHALRVWSGGVQVRCNAALQYASQRRIARQDAVAQCLKIAPAHPALAAWYADGNGMLCTHFADAYISELALRQAQFFRRDALSVHDSGETFFFEKCVWLRARHILQRAQCACVPDESWRDVFFEAVCRQQAPRPKDITRTAAALDARLNRLLDTQSREDFAAEALAGVLGRLIAEIGIKDET